MYECCGSCNVLFLLSKAVLLYGSAVTPTSEALHLHWGIWECCRKSYDPSFLLQLLLFVYFLFTCKIIVATWWGWGKPTTVAANDQICVNRYFFILLLVACVGAAISLHEMMPLLPWQTKAEVITVRWALVAVLAFIRHVWICDAWLGFGVFLFMGYKLSDPLVVLFSSWCCLLLCLLCAWGGWAATFISLALLPGCCLFGGNN